MNGLTNPENIAYKVFKMLYKPYDCSEKNLISLIMQVSKNSGISEVIPIIRELILENIIQENNPLIKEDVLSSTELHKYCNFESNQKFAKWLRNLGYIKYPKNIKIDNVVHNVWFKNIGLNKVPTKLKEK